MTDYDELLNNISRRLAQMEVDFETCLQCNTSLTQRIAKLEANTPLILEGGRLPSKQEISLLECQIFHKPDLTANERKARTEWSLRLTCWMNGKRAKPDINVRLFTGQQFYGQVMNRNTIPPTLDNVATAFRDKETARLGMLQEKTKGKGNPFIPDQFCVVQNFNSNTPGVSIVIGDDDVLEFSPARPAKGVKANHAMWYLTWTG